MACAIELKGVQTAHGLQEPLSLQIERGSFVALVGPNGAGKSTFLRVIARQLSCLSGRIEIEQLPLESMSQKELAKRLAYLPQHIEIIDDFTVLQLISLGRLPYQPRFLDLLRGRTPDRLTDKQAIEQAINAMQLEQLTTRTAGTLSGGELQRVHIARALAQEASILLLDEPTAHLDLRASLELLECLQKRRSQQELTIVLAIHDLNLAALFCDRLLLLHQGRLLADGTPEAICQLETLAPAYGSNLKIIDHPEHHRPQILPCRAAQN